MTPLTFLIASQDGPITAIRDAWTRILKNNFVKIAEVNLHFVGQQQICVINRLKQSYVLVVVVSYKTEKRLDI